MPESALLERSETTQEELQKEWQPIIDAVGIDYALRDTIFEKIAAGEKPPDLNEVSLDSLRKKTEVEHHDDYQEGKERLIIKKPEDLGELDKTLNSYMELLVGENGEIPDDSLPPGEVLRFKDDWSDYEGWDKGSKERLRNKLKDKLKGISLDDGQAETAMELFLMSGKRPDKVIVEIDQAFEIARRVTLGDRGVAEVTDEQIKYLNGNPEAICLVLLGIDPKQVRHFVLPDMYEYENDYEIYYQQPRGIEELAYQIMQAPGKGLAGWGVRGERPLLEMRVARHEKDVVVGGEVIYKKGDIDTKKSGYRVNNSNMTNWARYNMYAAYDFEREDALDFFKTIAVKTRSPLSLHEMLLNQPQYFRSEDGKTEYKKLLLQWYQEAAIFSTLRQWDVAYREVIGEPEELMKVFRQMFTTKNLLTRGALGSSLFNLMMTMPLDFEGREGGNWVSDNKMGAAVVDIYRAYDRLSDFEGLVEVFGRGSKFFTKAGWIEALGKVLQENVESTGISETMVFAGFKESGLFAKAFDKNGEITSRENMVNFIKFIDIFGNKRPGAKIEFAVREAVKNAVAEKFGTEIKEVRDKDTNKLLYKKHGFITTQGKKGEKIADTETLALAEAFAWSMTRPFGAHAKNDVDGVDHDEMSKRYNTYKTRIKYFGKGDKTGNGLTISAFKRMTVDPFNAITTEAWKYVTDENGERVRDKSGKWAVRDKTIMEVMMELSEFQTLAANESRALEAQLRRAEKSGDEILVRDLERKIAEHNDKSSKKYQNLAEQMSFRQRTLSNYYEDHVRHSNKIYEQTMANQEMEWEKYTSYDALGGVRFMGAKFQEDFQDKWLHKLRYMFENYGDLNFNMKVRMLNQEETARLKIREGRPGEPVYEEVYLGEALFGHEILNRKKFWKLDKRGRPIHKRDKRGRKMRGVYEIDYQKVQDNKKDVWKSWLLMKIAADFYSHRALHENEPRFNFTYYQQAIGAIARLHGDIEQNEFDFKGTEGIGTFFSKEDIAWLKRKARVENFDLYWRAFFKDIFKDDKPEEGIGLLLALSLATKAILEFKN